MTTGSKSQEHSYLTERPWYKHNGLNVQSAQLITRETQATLYATCIVRSPNIILSEWTT